MARNVIGQGTQIQTEAFSSDKFITLADHLDKIRGERSE